MLRSLLTTLALVTLLPSCDSSSAQNRQAEETQTTAIVQILPSTPVLADPALRTENFIANEIAALSMGEVLHHASENRNWKERDIQISTVQRSLKVERIPGTDMARLTFPSNDKQLAQDILNGVIEAYLNLRKRLETSMSERALQALDNELIAQSDLVQDNRKNLTVLIQQYGIPYFDSIDYPLGKSETEMFTKSRHHLQDIQTEHILLRGEMRALDENDPERVKLQQNIKILSSQIDLLSEKLNDRRSGTVDLALKQYPYNQAKESYEQSRDLLQKMKQRQQEARVALKMPITPLIVRQKPQ